MGIKITTDQYPVRIWRNDKHGFPQYAVTISKPKDDGSGDYVRAYQEVRFKKGIELENGEEIFIQHAFPVLRTWKDGKKQIWQIIDFTYARQRPKYQPEPRQVSYDDMPDTFSQAEDDIPF